MHPACSLIWNRNLDGGKAPLGAFPGSSDMHPEAIGAGVGRASGAGPLSVRGLQCAAQPPDDDATGAVVGRGLDLVADVKHEP